MEKDLFEILADMQDADECKEFLKELCGEKTFDLINERFSVAKMLYQRHVYNYIVAKTGASSATVSRIKREIIDKENGTVRRVLEKRR